MQTPKISIIVPAYNAAEYIGKTIASLQEQTYKNIEIVIVNDGSKDNTLEICRTIASTDERIVIVDQQNQGPGAARNTGINHASGEFIAFCDSDDLYPHNACQIRMEALQSSSADCVVTAYEFINNDFKKYIRLSFDKDLYCEDEIKHELLSHLLCHDRKYHEDVLLPIYAIFNKLYRARVIKENNIHFNTGRKIGEDWQFNIDFLCDCKKIFFCNESTYHYNQGMPNSLTMQHHDNVFDIRLADILRYEIKLPYFDWFGLTKSNDKKRLWFECAKYYSAYMNKQILNCKLEAMYDKYRELKLYEIPTNDTTLEMLDSFAKNGNSASFKKLLIPQKACFAKRIISKIKSKLKF